MNTIASNNPLFTESVSIKNICAPLAHLEITGFFYFRVYSNGTFINFSTNLKWTEFFLDKFFQGKYLDFEIERHFFIKDEIILWEMSPQNIMWQEAKEIFQIGNGVTLSIPNDRDFIEAACFYSDQENFKINNFYLNNIEILRDFLLYFKDKANKLIKRAESNRLIIPEFYKNICFSIKKQPQHEYKNKNFYSLLDMNRFYMDDNRYLTRKEGECLTWLIKGKTAEEIGIILNCKKRTIETHINNIKNKLKCFSKSDLIRCGLNSGVIRFF